MKLTKGVLIANFIPFNGYYNETIYILPDGTLWDGGFDMGKRGAEHRDVEEFTKHNRYDGDLFWREVMVDLGLVMVIPETKTVLIHPDYTPTREQSEHIKNYAHKSIGFSVSDYK